MTIGRLKELLEAYPDDMPVVTCHPLLEHWEVEGSMDGPRLSRVFGHEVRTGWHALHESEAEVDPQFRHEMLLISTVPAEIMLEYQDEAFGGPSPYAGPRDITHTANVTKIREALEPNLE